MNPKIKLFAACSLGLGGFALGFLAGGGRASMKPGGQRAADHSELAAGADFKSSDSSSPAAQGGERGQFATLSGATEKEGRFFSAFREQDDLKRTHDLVDAAGALSLEEIPGLIARIRAMPPDAREMLMPYAISRWAQMDPKAAGDYLVTLTDKNGRDRAMRYVMAAFVDQSVDAAKAWATSLPPGYHRTNAVQSLISSLAKRDPMKALAILQEMPAETRSTSYQTVFGAWAQTDAQGAAAKVMELPKGANRDGAIRSVASSWAQNSPADAFAWAQGIQEKSQQSQALQTIISQWASLDPQGARSASLALPSGDLRNNAVSTLISQIAGRSPDEAKALLAELPEGSVRSGGASMLVNALAYTDPKAAAELVTQFPTDRRKGDSVSNVAIRFARSDTASALTWAESLPAETRNSAFSGIAYTWSQQDPKAAFDYFAKHELMSADGFMVNQALRNWSQSDSTEALAWARALPDGKVKDRALSTVVVSMADNDPREAAKMIQSLPASSQDDAAGSLAARWANNDPGAAALWAASLPEGDSRSKATRSIVATWAERDVAKTAAWLEKLPSGISRDAAVYEFSRQVTDKDPAGAAAWAGTIYDAGQRDVAMERIYRHWSRTDQQGAATFIANSPVVSDTMKQRLLTPVTTQKPK